jgi:protein adenylyltransferase
MITGTGFVFDNTYARQLNGLFEPWQAAKVPQPTLVKLNHALVEELGLDAKLLDSAIGAAIFSGNHLPQGATPLAQAYAGHQFGAYVPQLGDGRALLLGEMIDRNNLRRDIALKGSGPTPFSRGGDGKATLGPVLREYLFGEAMHALGIPTTRALAAVSTGETVRRDRFLPGAVLTRLAASHIRVGTFQFVAASGDEVLLRRLADYAIQRHYPALKTHSNPYLSLLQTASERQAELIARWMSAGFIHGVMNTDNMTLSGETIDYGPCAFMDLYNPTTVFSSIDSGGRYAYANQPQIAHWNLARLAETLLPLMDDNPKRAVALANEVVRDFPLLYQRHWLHSMRKKLGLTLERADDLALATDFLATMEGQDVDLTQAFRRLSDVAEGTAHGENNVLRSMYADPSALDSWLERWRMRLCGEPLPSTHRALAMRAVNPVYIPRNHRVEEALSAAVEQGDFTPFEKLLTVLLRPFDEKSELAAYAAPAPAAFSARHRTFCGT